jgi:hypothetical protein
MREAMLVMLVCVAAGCNDLEKVKKELEAGGFALWYPAEAGVEPGQIWATNGKQKVIQQLRPDGLKLFGPNSVQFRTLSKRVNADASLKAAFAGRILGEAEDLAVLLTSANVKNVTLDFGETNVSRVVLGDLSDPKIKEQLPEGYLKDLEKVRTRHEYVLIAAVVTSSGMKFTFTCDDTKQLEAKVPEIKKLIKGEFNLNVSSGTKASWEIPETNVLAIGTTLVSGDIVRLQPKEVKSRALDAQSALLKLRTVPLEQLLQVDQ